MICEQNCHKEKVAKRGAVELRCKIHGERESGVTRSGREVNGQRGIRVTPQ